MIEVALRDPIFILFVSLSFHCRFTDASLSFHSRFTVVSQTLHCRFTDASLSFHSRFTVPYKVYQFLI